MPYFRGSKKGKKNLAKSRFMAISKASIVQTHNSVKFNLTLDYDIHNVVSMYLPVLLNKIFYLLQKQKIASIMNFKSCITDKTRNERERKSHEKEKSPWYEKLVYLVKINNFAFPWMR